VNIMMSTLLRASIDGAVMVAAIWLVTRLLSLSPATRTVLWWCAAAKFVLALAWTTPIAVPLLPAQVLSSQVVTRAAPVVENGVPPADVFSRVASRVGPRLSSRLSERLVPGPAVTEAIVEPFRGLAEWAVFALIFWVGGLVLLAFVAFRRWRETAAIVRASVAVGPGLQRRAADLCERLGLRRVPQVRVSSEIETPLVTGLIRPVVMLPADRFGTLTDRQQEMALCHELAHLKRADLWLGCVPALAERLFFFHPLVQLASREYSLAREAACDAAVVETLDAAPREYGSLLLALGVSRPQTGAAAGAAGSFQHFKRRIAMLQDLPSRSNRSRVIAAGVVGLALAAMIPLRLVARPATSTVETSATGRSARVAQGNRTASEPISVEAERQVKAEQEPRASSESGVRFVLLLEDNQRTISGPEDDLPRARAHQRNGEPLLWFRYQGREYVIRDREVLREVQAAWKRVYDSDLGRHASEAAQDLLAGDLGKLIGDHVGTLAANAAALVAEPAAQFGAELGAQLGVQLGQLGAAAAVEALSSLQSLGPVLGNLAELEHMPRIDVEIDQRELERHTREAEKIGREVNKAVREFQERFHEDLKRSLRQDLDLQRDQMRELREHMRELERSLRDMKEPLKDLEEPMKEFGRHMESFGQQIGDATRDAMDDMRVIIERAVKSGIAQPVK
jgi:bla regulator protein BlaR1